MPLPSSTRPSRRSPQSSARASSPRKRPRTGQSATQTLSASARFGGRFGGRNQLFRNILARYDAAVTTQDSERHWANADHLSAAAANSPAVRRTTRSRARYEAANNSYIRGMVDTIADHVIATGPRLQMTPGDQTGISKEDTRFLEREFSAWMKAVKLAGKLRQLKISQIESGEVFLLMDLNPRLPGDHPQLDLKIIEADQCTDPAPGLVSSSDLADGIDFDTFGNPTAYYFLREHPGDGIAKVDLFEAVRIDAARVIHLFRATRPGQVRGITELLAGLPLCALMRRYTLAAVHAAENAAMLAGVIKTDAPPDGESADITPMDEVDLERNSWLTLPAGWDITQVKAEHPNSMYDGVIVAILREIARGLGLPYIVAAADSSRSNFSGAKLDLLGFALRVRTDRQLLEETVLDRLFRAWFDEAVLIEGFLPQSLRRLVPPVDLSHRWIWPPAGGDPGDESAQATAAATRITSGLSTLADEYARQGKDWEEELHQRASERDLMEELGLPMPSAPGNTAPETPGSAGSSGGDKSEATQENSKKNSGGGENSGGGGEDEKE